MLIPSAVVLALVATLGVHEASAQKGKEQRKEQPVKVRIISENLTTGEIGRHISASAGDEVRITLRVDNRSGEAQDAEVHIFGGVPGNWYDDTIIEGFAAGQRKEGSFSGFVPADESGTLLVNASVLMTKSNDFAEWDGSVDFNLAGKAEAPSPSILHQIFARMMFRSLLSLSSDGTSSVSMSELKELYR
jgi:hypothetical protein